MAEENQVQQESQQVTTKEPQQVTTKEPIVLQVRFVLSSLKHWANY